MSALAKNVELFHLSDLERKISSLLSLCFRIKSGVKIAVTLRNKSLEVLDGQFE